jgi:hypothetical protein
MSEDTTKLTVECPFCSYYILYEYGAPPTYCQYCHTHLPPEFVQSSTRERVDSSPNSEAVRCRFCDLEISATDTECPSCGYGTPKGVQLEEAQSAQTKETSTHQHISNTSSQGVSSTATPRQTAAVMKRYQDAYRMAKLTILFGKIIKGAGIAVAAISIVFGGNLNGGPMPGLYGGLGIVAIVIGVIVGGFIFINGVRVSAQGQAFMATLDSAVHSSPFLTNEQRARIMSLPLS